MLKNFVDSMNNTVYLYIDYPQKDSLSLVKDLQKRLVQAGVVKLDTLVPDSVLLSTEIKKYQSAHRYCKRWKNKCKAGQKPE